MEKPGTPSSRRNSSNKSRQPSREFEISGSANGSTSDNIFSWDLNPFQIEDNNLLNYAVRMFEHYNLLKYIKIDSDDLIHFLRKVKNSYHDNPFHNFTHVWSVLHQTFMLLSSGADKYFRLIHN